MGGGNGQSIGSTVSDAIVRSRLGLTSIIIRSYLLGYCNIIAGSN